MNIKLFFRFLMIVLAFGIGVTVLPQSVSAQTEKENKEKKQDCEKEDDDDDETLTAEDKSQVKFSLADAREIALKRIAGKVVDEELEKENGRLQYAFDIRDADGKLFDVEIDAVTGEVLQAEEEDDDDDDVRTGRKSIKDKNAKRTAKVVITKPN